MVHYPRHTSRPPLEQRYIDETIASIRLRTRYNDPYEEWEKQTRKDALVSCEIYLFTLALLLSTHVLQKTARKELADTQAYLHELQDRKHVAEQKRLELVHTKQLAEIQGVLDRAKEVQQKEETNLKQRWKLRDQLLWERIEAGIKVDEERAKEEAKERARVEAEKKAKEEAEKRAKEEAEKAKEEAERAKEEAEKRAKEEAEKRAKEEAEEKAKEEADEKSNLANDDWRVARQNLLVSMKFPTSFINIILTGHIQSLKQPVRYVKSNKELKAAWGVLRRQIVPKIGQLTNDPQAISLIVRL